VKPASSTASASSRRTLAGALPLLRRQGDPLLDLAAAFGGPAAQPALELVERRVHEDDDRSGNPVLHVERALELELEQRHVPFLADAVDLGEQRAGLLPPREDDVLEELARVEAAVELRGREDPVVDAVALARPPRPGGCRDRQPQHRHALEQRLNHRSLAGTRGAGDDEDPAASG
jgi:hypothetical protein